MARAVRCGVSVDEARCVGSHDGTPGQDSDIRLDALKLLGDIIQLQLIIALDVLFELPLNELQALDLLHSLFVEVLAGSCDVAEAPVPVLTLELAVALLLGVYQGAQGPQAHFLLLQLRLRLLGILKELIHLADDVVHLRDVEVMWSLGLQLQRAADSSVAIECRRQGQGLGLVGQLVQPGSLQLEKSGIQGRQTLIGVLPEVAAEALLHQGLQALDALLALLDGLLVSG
mmetsp:Transcript_51654/g.109757  ORF Transcript_51654/g.109757 Transcript_51654/m.109757 type:complete len:230 (+) Transcript_51654:798-1487(+)